MRTGDVRLVWPLAASLAEGPVWLRQQRQLCFVDILGRQLHRFDPDADTLYSYAMPGTPSFALPADDGSLVVGMNQALLRVDDGVVRARLATVGDDAGVRTNDATVDAAGRIWFGTMDLGETRPVGKLHCYDGGELRAHGGDCAISNGPAISPDGRTLYHVDTRARTIWSYSLDGAALGARREFAVLAGDEGFPDGVTVDAEGAVWVGVWGGGCVRRYSPAGDCLERIALPCSQVTKVAFGGADLRTVYVTTARTGLSPERLRAEPLAGGLFAFEATVPGLPGHVARLPR